MTVTLIDATGVRSEMSGSTHGAAGDTQVITALPALEPGDVSLRWRLVGPDGHPITGRVDLTIAAPATTRPENAAAVPEIAVTVPSIADGAITADSSVADRNGGAFSTPSALRWVLRYGSYLAISLPTSAVRRRDRRSGRSTLPRRPMPAWRS